MALFDYKRRQTPLAEPNSDGTDESRFDLMGIVAETGTEPPSADVESCRGGGIIAARGGSSRIKDARRRIKAAGLSIPQIRSDARSARQRRAGVTN